MNIMFIPMSYDTLQPLSTKSEQKISTAQQVPSFDKVKSIVHLQTNPSKSGTLCLSPTNNDLKCQSLFSANQTSILPLMSREGSSSPGKDKRDNKDTLQADDCFLPVDHKKSEGEKSSALGISCNPCSMLRATSVYTLPPVGDVYALANSNGHSSSIIDSPEYNLASESENQKSIIEYSVRSGQTPMLDPKSMRSLISRKSRKDHSCYHRSSNQKSEDNDFEGSENYKIDTVIDCEEVLGGVEILNVYIEQKRLEEEKRRLELKKNKFKALYGCKTIASKPY